MPAPPAEVNAMWALLRATINTVLPQVTADGIYRARQVAKKGYDTLKAPYVIVTIGEAAESDFAPVNAVAWMPKISIYYVQDDQEKTDNAALVENELNALGSYFRNTPLSYGQVITVSKPDVEADNPINVTLLKGKIPRTGGSVDIDFLFGRVGRP